MPVAGGGFEQCYNAQAVVAADSLLVVATDVVQAPNDKQQLEPMLGKVAELPAELGKVSELLADNGYYSEGNVNACAAAGIEPVIAMGREVHHPALAERFAEDPPAPENPTPVEAMRHRLQTKAGKKRYALRKQTPEPVFGIIKSVLGFRQFLLRGLDKVRGEWSLVTMAPAFAGAGCGISSGCSPWQARSEQDRPRRGASCGVRERYSRVRNDLCEVKRENRIPALRQAPPSMEMRPANDECGKINSDRLLARPLAAT